MKLENSIWNSFMPYCWVCCRTKWCPVFSRQHTHTLAKRLESKTTLLSKVNLVWFYRSFWSKRSIEITNNGWLYEYDKQQKYGNTFSFYYYLSLFIYLSVVSLCVLWNIFTGQTTKGNTFGVNLKLQQMDLYSFICILKKYLCIQTILCAV